MKEATYSPLWGRAKSSMNKSSQVRKCPNLCTKAVYINPNEQVARAFTNSPEISTSLGPKKGPCQWWGKRLHLKLKLIKLINKSILRSNKWRMTLISIHSPPDWKNLGLSLDKTVPRCTDRKPGLWSKKIKERAKLSLWNKFKKSQEATIWVTVVMSTMTSQEANKVDLMKRRKMKVSYTWLYKLTRAKI